MSAIHAPMFTEIGSGHVYELVSFVAYADCSQTGGSARIGLYDSSSSLLIDVPLGHGLAGTISSLVIFCLNGSSGTRVGRTFLPEDEGGFGDPMTLYEITESGIVTDIVTGVSYIDYNYGANLNTGSYPFSYDSGPGVITLVWHLYLSGDTKYLRVFATDYSYPTSAATYAAEVVQFSDASILDAYTGDNVFGQVLADYPSLSGMLA